MPRTSLPLDAGLGQHAADGFDGRVDPVLRALLGPERMLHAHVFVRSGDGRDLPALRVHDQRARSARPDIDPHPVHIQSLCPIDLAWLNRYK